MNSSSETIKVTDIIGETSGGRANKTGNKLERFVASALQGCGYT